MNNLLAALIKIAQKNGSNEELFNEFSDNFLLYGSETPENIECINELSLIDNEIFGLGLKCGCLITDVLNSAEGCNIPNQVREDFPDITQSQWDATLRMCTMIMTLFEFNKKGAI